MSDDTQNTAQASPFFTWLNKNGWVYWLIALLIFGGIGFGIYKSQQPKQGGVLYGICKTLMNFEYQYPFTFDVLTVTQGSRDVRMFMAETNSFGQERIVQVDCDFSITDGRMALTRLTLDRKAIPDERIQYYNRIVPTLRAMSDELDRDLPEPLPRSLQELKR